MSMQTVSLAINTTQADKVSKRHVIKRIDACAEGCGDFAVHRTIGSPEYWTITHRGTGYAFGQRFGSRKAARETVHTHCVTCSGHGGWTCPPSRTRSGLIRSSLLINVSKLQPSCVQRRGFGTKWRTEP